MAKLDAALLKDLPPFQGVDDDGLARLLDKADAVRREKGQRVFEQGDPVDAFFLLLDGHVRVVKINPQGEQIIVRYISSGELLGIGQAIGLTSYPASAIAARDCVLLRWPTTHWGAILERYPGFATNTYATVGGRLQDMQDRIMEMATERVEQRVAHALLKLVEQTGRKTDEGVLIDFPISRQDISEMTGTTLHTVSRLLSAWEQEGLVKSGRQRITVTGDNQLKQLSQRVRN